MDKKGCCVGMRRFLVMKTVVRATLVLVLGGLFLSGSPAEARKKKKTEPKAPMVEESKAPFPGIAEKTRGFEAQEGFLELYFDRTGGRIWWVLPTPDESGLVMELIFLEGLTTGLGSNPVGLDRGQVGRSRLLRVRRMGPRVLFEEPNLKFRALTDDPAELRATEESFAPSVLWGQEIAALDSDGRALIDLTPFLVRDVHAVSRTLRDTGQGHFSLDPQRSAVDFGHCHVFPDNVELEARLTYAGSEPGPEVVDTVPQGEAFTLSQHISLVRLPEPGFELRPFDPRIGFYGSRFLDYASAIDEPMDRRFLERFRLQKAEPEKARSKAVKPLVFYVDPGVPEPVRSALVEGASWWAAAFEAAGFEEAYRVEILPPGVHPLDVRYNVIQWVHRSTRGWSYGSTLVDPRTGEILKGHVNLGSLRVRQDRLLFEGLAGTAETGTGSADDPVQLALARIRQLAAHEVGHTLGLPHNFAASTYDGRASVMDYPAPLVKVREDGSFDFSAAYGVGVGSWDVHCIRYGYTEFPPGADEKAELEALVREGLDRGLVFLTDEDARPPGASDPRANLWDNGTDPVDALELALQIRRLALERFGAHNLPAGRPLAELEEVLAPVYFRHRYPLDAAVKVVGGMEYSYAVSGDGQEATRVVDGERQRRALAVILSVLEPARLDLRDEVLALLPPRPFGWPPSRESFASASAPAFDPLGAARTTAEEVLVRLLEPHRLGRLMDFHRRDPNLPGVAEVLQTLVDTVLGHRKSDLPPRHEVLQDVVERVMVDRLMTSAFSQAPLLRAELEAALSGLRARLEGSKRPARISMAQDIGRFLERQSDILPAYVPPAPMPPGSPIGSESHFSGCGFDDEAAHTGWF